MRFPVAVLVGALLFAGDAGQDQRPTFRATADLVAVEASVRDRTRVVTDLKANDFELLDNGVRQEIFDLSYGKLPIDVTVALDVSYSVTGDLLERLQRGVKALVSDLGQADRLRLVLFNMQVRRVVDFTSDPAAIETAIRTASAGGGTSIFDAISVELVSAEHSDRRQLLVVFSDGADALSTTEPPVLLEVAARSVAAVTTVLPAGPGGVREQTILNPSGSVSRIVSAPNRESPQQQRRREIYRQLAAETGGIVMPMAQSGQDLAPLFRRALDEFRSTYVLQFAPRGVKPGGFHTLRVDVPGRKGLTIRARRGYWSD